MAERIGLFFPRPTAFYAMLFADVSRALERQGIEVRGGTHCLSGDELHTFCREFKPRALIEMNRSRADVPDLPRGIVHVCWLTDTGGRSLPSFQDSEIFYYFCPNWLRVGRPAGAKIVDWLPPGTNPEIYYPDAGDQDVDFGFAGHLSPPWTDEELDRPIRATGARQIRFSEVLCELERYCRQADLTGWFEDDYVEHALDVVEARIGERPPLDLRMRYDFGARVILRMMSRQRLLDLALEASSSAAFYGPGGWQRWPRYAAYHHGVLEAPADMRRLYCRSRLGIHEGIGLHFRSMDCMASGGVLFLLAGPDDERYGGIASCFESGTHYVRADATNFVAEARRYMADSALRKRIGSAATAIIRAEHTWDHRARRMLTDIASL